ncbi:MAG: hypothetical protein ACOCP5_00465 [Halanaerobiaceae bacterium]
MKVYFLLILIIIFFNMTGCDNLTADNNIQTGELKENMNKTEKDIYENEVVKMDEVILENQKRESIDQEIYVYRNSFRDPFTEEEVDKSLEKEIIKKLRSVIPFTIKGIILKKENPRVLIQKNNDIKIIEKGDVIDDYKVIEIKKGGIILKFKNYEINYEIGG